MRVSPLGKSPVLTLLLAACLAACSGSFGDTERRLSVRGSDTMVILAQRWAERYMQQHPGTAVQVTGGGSGTGLASLINGTTDIANASRPVSERERRYLRRNRGAAAHAVPVALDAVAVYVHEDNPIDSLTLAQLRAIFRGRIDDWSELGQPSGPIVLYSRENNSGTYAYFKEHVLDGLDFASAAQTLPGTAAVINAVSRDPRGIGYGGIGYGGGVRTVPLREGAEAPVAPTAENAIDGTYPLARALYMVTAGAPEGVAGDFVEWVRSPEGQRLVRDIGFYPLPNDRREPSS
jgi:phosphate transport system substrate-binding protein